MKWFEGEIPAAIADSRQKQGVFAVVILHNPEENRSESEKMETYWSNINEDSCLHPIVAIKIFDGTSTKDHFSRLYSIPVIPAAYLIDPNGKPLEVITLTNAPDETAFTTRLHDAVNKLVVQQTNEVKRIKEPHGVQPSSSQSAQEPSSTIGITGSQHVENDVESVKAGDKTVSSEALLTLDEKVQRAQELLAKKHAEDEKKIVEQEKMKEIERRHLGKLMAEAKSNRDDVEIRAAAEQRRRERLENEKQLQKLREQIKADREERMNREQKEVKPITQQAETCILTQRNKPSSNDCRIQVKFLDRSVLVLSFQPTDAFSLLVDRIKEDGRQGNEFVLTQIYPRREFGEEDYSLTFAELNLVPSATILVFRSRRRAERRQPAHSSWNLSSLFETVLLPIQAFLQYLFSFIWSNQNTPRVTGTVPDKSQKSEENRRPEGNIHRFHNENDSARNSDDEARWNGNSTQQL